LCTGVELLYLQCVAASISICLGYSATTCECLYVKIYVSICGIDRVCMCVCERERDRERERLLYFCIFRLVRVYVCEKERERREI